MEVAEHVNYDITGKPSKTSLTHLSIHWGLHREWLDEWLCLPDLPRGHEFDDVDSSRPAMRTSLATRPGDEIFFRGGFPMRSAQAKFEIPAYFAPLELDFVLVRKDPVTNIESIDGPRTNNTRHASTFALPLGMAAGVPAPLGASRLSPERMGPGWVNFALHSATATKVTLILQWTNCGEAPETLELALNPTTHRTGDIWHVALPFSMQESVLPVPVQGYFTDKYPMQTTTTTAVLYGYKCDGDTTQDGWRFHPAQVMFDPRASLLVPPLGPFPDPNTIVPRYMGSLTDVLNDGAFQLAKYRAQDFVVTTAHVRQIPAQEVIYELSVSDFTAHTSAYLPPGQAGTFAGVLSKVDYIVSTGVTTVLLQSVFTPGNMHIGVSSEGAPISFFAPNPAYAKSGGSLAVHELREMVRGLHSHGIEVLMHTVLTYMGEGTDMDPNSASLRGIDPVSYYKVGYSGVLEANECALGAAVLDSKSTATQGLILDALRHWRTAFGIDGFILHSSCDCGDSACQASLHPVVLESIALDPVLGGVGKGASVRVFLGPGRNPTLSPHHFGGFGEVNASYGDGIAQFFERIPGSVGAFMSCICGSANHFRKSRCTSQGHVLNTLTISPKDMSLADLVSELGTRTKLEPRLSGVVLRSMLVCLFVSDGIPMISSGDEYGHSSFGQVSSLSSSLETEPTVFRWDATAKYSEGACMRSFIAALCAFRHRRADLFSAGGNNVSWSGLDGATPNAWNDPLAPSVAMCRRTASTLSRQLRTTTQDVVVIFNGSAELVPAVVGHPPPGFVWVRVIDTSLVFPSDCALTSVTLAGPRGTYLVAPHTVLVLEMAPSPLEHVNPTADLACVDR